MDRRAAWKAMVGAAAGCLIASSKAAEPVRVPPGAPGPPRSPSSYIAARDGTNLYYKDWGTGPAMVFLAPWSLNSNWWEYQMSYLVDHGLRCIAYDRRGHGRSDEPTSGYEFDTLASDLAVLIEQLDLRDVMLVGHSMGCAEAVRYLARSAGNRVARAVLISTITPFTLKTADNPEGVDERDLEKGRVALAKDRPHQIAIAAPAFFGAPPNTVSSEMMDWWVRMMVDQCSLKVMLDLHRVFTTTDFRPDLRKIEVPVRLIHGDHDTSTPLEFTARRSLPLIPRCELKVYENAAHALPITHMDRLNAELLTLVKA